MEIKMKILKYFFLNVSLWLSIITFSIVIFSENIFEKSDTLYDLLITFVSIILTICYYWLTSIKSVNYSNVNDCLNDIMSDVLTFATMVCFSFFWFILSPAFLNNLGDKYIIILVYFIVMSVATLGELYVTVKNSLENMYRKNPITVASN